MQSFTHATRPGSTPTARPAASRRGRTTIAAAASTVPLFALAFAMMDGVFVVAAGALLSVLGMR